MLDLAEVGNGVWDDGFGKDGLRPFELATIRLQRLERLQIGEIPKSWMGEDSERIEETESFCWAQLGACFVGDGCFRHCSFWQRACRNPPEDKHLISVAQVM